MSFRSDGTRPGAWDGAFPSSRSQSGMRAGGDDRRDDEATARGRALGTEPSPPLAPSQGCEQETTTAETTKRRHEPGVWDGAFPSSRSQSGMRAGDDDRRDDGATARGRALETEPSPPLAPSQGCKQETTTAETTKRRHEAGRLGWRLLLPSLPVRDASRGRRWRYHEGTSGTNKLGAF